MHWTNVCANSLTSCLYTGQIPHISTSTFELVLLISTLRLLVLSEVLMQLHSSKWSLNHARDIYNHSPNEPMQNLSLGILKTRGKSTQSLSVSKWNMNSWKYFDSWPRKTSEAFCTTKIAHTAIPLQLSLSYRGEGNRIGTDDPRLWQLNQPGISDWGKTL